MNVDGLGGYKWINKVQDNKYFIWGVFLITWLFGTLYYYGLQMAFIPNSEDLSSVWRSYQTLKLRQPFYFRDLLHDGLSLITTWIGGMSYFSLRILFAAQNSVLLALTMYLSFWNNKKQRADVFLLPLFALFMIFLHPVTSDDAYGLIVDYGTDFFYQYPYNYHYSERIYTLICLGAIRVFQTTTFVAKKKVCLVVLALLSFYNGLILKSTLVFLLFFVPFCFVVFLEIMHNYSLRKYAFLFVYFIMGGIMLTKTLPAALRGELWTKESAYTYGVIYGATNWISLDAFGTAIINYIIKILECFNILLPASPVISLYTFIYVLKLCLLIVGYIIIFIIVKGSIIGKRRWMSVDVVDEVLAWSYLILSAAHIFTEYGLNVIYSQRYIVATVSIMTILLCRHLVSFLQDIRWILLEISEQEKLVLFFVFASICFCYMKPVWSYTPTVHCHLEDMYAAIDYMKGTDFGCAIAPDYLAKAMSATSNGELLVYNSIDEAKQLEGQNTQISYMITRCDYEYGKYHQYMYYENFENYEQLCRKYSEPTNVIEYNTFSLFVWEDGIQVEE